MRAACSEHSSFRCCAWRARWPPKASAWTCRPIDTYLALLAQVAPPARDGAEAYMAAFRSRCGRALRTIELRRAFAQGNGDPVLMNMVRASHERDTAALQRLGASIACPSK